MRPPQSWPTSVMPGQLELVEQRGAHPLDVAGVGVVGAAVGLVRATEAHQVGGDAPGSPAPVSGPIILR